MTSSLDPEAYKRILGFADLPYMVQVQLRVLAKERKHRTQEDMNSLLPNLKENKFFKERGFDEASLLKILYNASFETVTGGDVVFREHDIGDKFYLILHGSVGVFKANPKYKTLKRDMRKTKKRILNFITKLDDLLELK